MTVAADYARAVAYLRRADLPAYVSFIERDSARGLGREQDDDGRIYVRMSDRRIVSGVPPASSHAIETSNGGTGNPFRKNGVFRPDCYQPQHEETVRWNGEPALRFSLKAICDKDDGISELYADPVTLRPIAADGTIPDTGESHMSVAIELRYTTIGPYTVPSSIRAHAVGHGWLFWARERVDVEYTGYAFYTAAEYARRQAARP